MLALFMCTEAQQMRNFPQSAFARATGYMHLVAFSEDIPDLIANINFRLSAQLHYACWGGALHPPKQKSAWNYETLAGSQRFSTYLTRYYKILITDIALKFKSPGVLESIVLGPPRQIPALKTILNAG